MNYCENAAQEIASGSVALPVIPIGMIFYACFMMDLDTDFSVSICGVNLNLDAIYVIISMLVYMVCDYIFYRYYFKSGRYLQYESDYYRERYSSVWYVIAGTLYIIVPFVLAFATFRLLTL